MNKEEIQIYFYKDEYGNYVISKFEDLGFNLEFEELNLLTKSLNSIGKYIEQLQQENKQLGEQIKIKQDAFTASVEECCEYAEKLDKLKNYVSTRKNIFKNTLFEKEFIHSIENILESNDNDL